MRVLYTGGGTGGHLTPIIAVDRQLKQIYNPDLETNPKERQAGLTTYFLGAKGPVNFGNLLEREGIKTKFIIAGKFRRYFSFKTLIDLFKVPLSLCQSLWYLFVWMPDIIFSKGGYGSLPVVLIGWLYRIPVITHESDSIPGLATRLGGKFSKRIAISFKRAADFFPEEKTALIGLPIRSEVIQTCLSTDPAEKGKARKVFGISNQKPVILFLGGSQGAESIDQVVLEILPQLFGKYEIIHQCRRESYNHILEETEAMDHYQVYPFLDEDKLKAAFLLADVIVSRAGATTIFEIAACGKPSILIPLSGSAFDHQRENAFAYAENGATIVIEQVNLTPNILLSEVNRIVSQPDLAKKIGDNAKNFAITEASSRIVEELIKLGLE